jgi:hypothetical protein
MIKIAAASRPMIPAAIVARIVVLGCGADLSVNHSSEEVVVDLEEDFFGIGILNEQSV